MNEGFLFLRKLNHIGTIIYKINIDRANEIIKEYKDKSSYEMGIIFTNDINIVNKVYREYAPYKQLITTEDELIRLISTETINLLPTIEEWRNRDLLKYTF